MTAAKLGAEPVKESASSAARGSDTPTGVGPRNSAAQDQQLDPLGEVWDDRGARWRCRIECKLNWRGKTVYRWVLERKWVSWRDYQEGWWTSSEAKANERGRAALLAHKHDRFEEVGRV